jgi:hypothetical protein
MNTKRKPDPKDPNYAAYIAEKQKILLTQAKRTIPGLAKEDDPFGDRELFDREVTRFFVCQGAKIEIDPKAKGKHRHVVKTSIFGGCAKHLDSIEIESFRSLLHHPTP